MDQRWPGTGWRERPPRYDYFITSSASLFSPAVCVFICFWPCLLMMPVLIRNLSLSNIGVFLESMFGEQRTADRPVAAAHAEL